MQQGLETILTCPLGSQCQEIKDGKLHQCAWFQKLVGKDPQTGEEKDEWGCAIAWLPLLSVEMSRTNQGQTAALESFRNEMVRGNEVTVQALLASAQPNSMKFIGPDLVDDDDG